MRWLERVSRGRFGLFTLGMNNIQNPSFFSANNAQRPNNNVPFQYDHGIVPPNFFHQTAVEREGEYRIARSVLRQPLWILCSSSSYATATQQTLSTTDTSRRDDSFHRQGSVPALLAFYRWHCPCYCCWTRTRETKSK